MTLNEFMTKVLGWIDKSESQASAASASADTQSKLDAANKAIAERDATIKDLTAKLEKAEADGKAFAAQVADLTAKLEAATKKTDEALASLGVAPKDIPADSPENQATAGNDILSKLMAIENPVARGEFYAKNRDAIKSAMRTRK